MPSLPVLILISASLLILASAVILAARRWRRINQRPLCRRCRYILDGVNAPTTCPECGADLSRSRRAIRIGERRASRPMVIVGLILLAGALASSVHTGVRIAREVKWIEIKPLWMLARDANGSNPALESVTVAEILRRARFDRIDKGDVQPWIDLALARQADQTRAWNSLWGDLVQYSIGRGWVNEAQIDAYLRGAVPTSWPIDHRARVHEGSRVAVRVRIPQQFRVGGDQSLPQFDLTMRYQTIKVGDHAEVGEDLMISDLGTTPIPVEWTRMMFRGLKVLSWPATIPAALPEGKHPVVVTMRIGIRASDPGKGIGGSHQGAERWPADNRLEWELVSTSEIEAVSAEQPLIEVVEDPEALEAWRSGMTSPSIRFLGGDAARLCHCEIEYAKPPMPLAWRVSLIIDGREWLLGFVRLIPGHRTPLRFFTPLEDIPSSATHAEIVLTADVQAALESLDIGDQILGGEIRIPNVPIRFDDPRFPKQDAHHQCRNRSTIVGISASPPAFTLLNAIRSHRTALDGQDRIARPCCRAVCFGRTLP